MGSGGPAFYDLDDHPSVGGRRDTRRQYIKRTREVLAF